MFPRLGDRAFLRVMRFSIVGFACVVLGFALYSNASIFKMVENAYKVTLAGAFVPLFAGALWKRATSQGALASIVGGLSSWLLVEFLIEESPVPPQLIGLAVGFVGMLLGSLLPQWIGRPTPQEDPHAALHHRAAAETHHAEPLHEHPKR